MINWRQDIVGSSDLIHFFRSKERNEPVNTSTSGLALGQDSSYLSRTNGHPSSAFKIGELASIKFADGTRKLCRIVKTSFNYGGHDSVELVDERGQLHCRPADDVGKIDVQEESNDQSDPSKYHKTFRMQNDNFEGGAIIKANPPDISSRSVESLEIEELRRFLRFCFRVQIRRVN